MANQFETAMAKYTKKLINKAINSIREDDALMYILYKLCIIKLYDITLCDELYSYNATACFKLNWLNPIAWILAIGCIITAIVCGIVEGFIVSLIAEINFLKQGFYTYFE